MPPRLLISFTDGSRFFDSFKDVSMSSLQQEEGVRVERKRQAKVQLQFQRKDNNSPTCNVCQISISSRGGNPCNRFNYFSTEHGPMPHFLPSVHECYCFSEHGNCKNIRKRENLRCFGQTSPGFMPVQTLIITCKPNSFANRAGIIMNNKKNKSKKFFYMKERCLFTNV